MHPVHLSAVALGAVVLGFAVHAARAPTIPAWQRRVFRSADGLPGWLYWILWPPMQLGNLVVGTVVGLLIATVADDGWLAIGVLVAAGVKLLAERLVRRWMSNHLEVRQRPGTSQRGAILRGDVPMSGPSFPSGGIVDTMLG